MKVYFSIEPKDDEYIVLKTEEDEYYQQYENTPSEIIFTGSIEECIAIKKCNEQAQ
jgi:hypothetical protein